MVKIIDEVMKDLPTGAGISEAVFEGSNIVLYTKNKEFLLDNKGVIKQIVDNIKKRVEVRADPTVVLDLEDTKKYIEKLLDEDKNKLNIIFDTQRSRVIIESEKPGTAIGKGGDILKEIKKETLWTPIVRRIPPMRSKLIENIRQVLYDYSDYRKKFLHKIGKRIYEGWTKSRRDEWVRLTCLGSAREVGRSCFLLQTPESKVLLDCGFNVAAPREYAFPYLDAPEFNIQELDAIVLCHSHIDHCGTVPFLYKMGFRGPTYATAPCRDVTALMCLDLIEIAQKEGNDAPYTVNDVKEFVKHSVCLEYEEVSDITPDMRLTLYNAGHTLGSAIAHLHIGNGLHNFLYSLDASTKVTVIDGEDNVKFEEIGKFIDEEFENGEGFIINNGNAQEKLNTKKYATIAFNPKTLKSEIVPITSFVRHTIKEDLFEIKTDSGREIKVTAGHSIFSGENGNIISKKVSELKEGDFIIGAKNLPSLNKEPIIDLLPYLGELRISIEDKNLINSLIEKHSENFSKLEANDKKEIITWLFDYYKGTFKRDIAKKYKIHTRRVARAFKILKLKYQPRVFHPLPNKLKINRDFARFLGYYIAEGNPSKNSQTVQIVNYNNEILNDCYNIIKNQFGIIGDVRYKDHCVLFNSKQLKKLLSVILKCGKNAYDKRTPKELLLANKEILSDFLYGYFSGDGGITIKKEGRKIYYTSKSKGLIDDVTFILLQFGLVARLNYNKYNGMYSGSIYNAEKIQEFLEEIGINNSQVEDLKKSLNLKWNKASFDLRIPLLALSKKAQASLSVTPWQNAQSCGITKLNEFDIDECDLSLIGSDLLFDKIKSIKKIKPSGKYVYDFRVQGYENFLGGEGFVFMHNTSDFNYEMSNLLGAAITRYPRVESVMMESTYGTKSDTSPDRKESEEELIKLINEVVEEKGKILMPVLGVGRSQEIMLILERAMREKKIPEMLVYVQGMIWDVTAIHTAYPDYLSPRVKRELFQKDHNPFLSPIFKKITSQKEMQEVKDGKGPYIIMATSGMLQGGPALEYFKHFAENPKNLLIFTCYQGVGSIGRRMEEGERELTFVSGGSKKPETTKVLMKIYTIKGFSGHSNFKQLVSWVGNLEPKPKKIITIHGDYSRCIELASVLYQMYRVETVAPKNLETIRLR